MVANVVYPPVVGEIHCQTAHEGVILVIYIAGQAVDVWHEAVAQFVVVQHRLVSRVTFGRQVVNFAVGVLAMHPEQRNKSAKLVPAGVQFAPFFHFGTALFGSLKRLLNTETTNIHGPVGQARHGKVDACRNLCFHVFPASANVATPGHSFETLHTREARTGQDEDPVIRIFGPLAFVNSFGIHQGKGIEVFG